MELIELEVELKREQVFEVYLNLVVEKENDIVFTISQELDIQRTISKEVEL